VNQTVSHKVSQGVSEQSSGEHQLAAAYDIVVVGGGAAGLSGALTLGRSRRSVLLLDAGEPRNAPVGGVHNYLFREGASPAALLEIGRAEVVQYGVRVVNARVTAARQLADDRAETLGPADGDTRFAVELADGRSVRARRLLVTTGLVDELPDVPGVAERWGRDVLHCPFCHGWEVRDQAIGILATGPMTAHSAKLFRQLSDDVVVFQHTAPPLSDEEAEELAARGITVVEGEVAALEIAEDRLAGVRLRSGEVIPRQAVVVAPRLVARVDFLRPFGLETSDMEMAGHVVASSIPADANGATAVPGIWAAGNITNPMGQVISAASAGMMAGAVINADLVAEETARAVAARRERDGRG